MEKKVFIETILTSATTNQRITPREDLLDVILRKIDNENKISSNLVWKYAASIALLISLNVAFISIHQKPKENNKPILENILFVDNQLY
jgi:hypothetical protein